MGELHLEIIVDRLKREFKVDANVGKPEVAYKESIQRAVTKVEGRFVRQTGGHGQYGHVVIDMEPAARGEGFVFVNDTVGGVIPKEFIGSVEKGIREALSRGVLAGYPVLDVKVHLIDGSYHEVDSSGPAFEVAGSLAFQEAAKRSRRPAPRADDERRGRLPGELPGRRHRRSQPPAAVASSTWDSGPTPA